MKKQLNNKDLERVDAAWDKLEPLMEDKAKQGFKLNLIYIKIFTSAAIVVLLSAIIFLTYNIKDQKIQYNTKYGQTLKVVLPDSSTVFLNGNSQLSYINNWDNDTDREVQVDGEAYFSVKHTKNDQKFFVRMANNLSVEVLGTEFNITKRNKKTRVVLSSGKIDLHIDNLKAGINVIQMKPGDLIEYQNISQSFTKEKVDPNSYSAWKTNKLIFIHTQSGEVLENLKETYGLKINSSDKVILNKRVSGSAPTNNINSLVKALSETFDVDFILTGDTIQLKNNSL